MGEVYLDNAATTQVLPEVTDAVTACMRDDFGNPSSAHRLGLAAANHVDASRRTMLAALGDASGCGQLLWTSGGTEADALAVLGAARARARRGKHVVATAIEHPAVLGACDQLAQEGFEVTLVPVEKSGHVTTDAIALALRDDTVLVACMLVNNELGSIQPVPEVARAVHARGDGIHVHCDAVQALGKMALDVSALGADSVAVSGHKLHGPKGVGALWLGKNARVLPLWSGGGQQKGMRSGTENVPGIVGFAHAANIAVDKLSDETDRLRTLAKRLVDPLMAAGLDVRKNNGEPSVPHIHSLALPSVPAEPMLHALEEQGFYVSAGSACASQKKGPSHVLKAIGVPDDCGTLRVSFSRCTNEDDVDRAALAIIELAHALRT